MSTLPQEFINRIKSQFPDNWESILGTFKHKKPTTLRANTLKTTSSELEKDLTKQGFELQKADIPDAFVLLNKTQRELTETKQYLNGELYVQGLSSMIPPIKLDPQPGETVLDICAAPGSKTTQISALMKNTGSVIACDLSKVRLYKLAANIKTLGVTNIQTLHMNGKDLWKRFPNTFDRVLVDVPCSLEGRFLESNPKTYKNWSPKKIKVLAEHQKHILRSAISCAKPGATIVYSTCTLSPDENEKVVEWILNREKDIELINAEQILPTELYEGFFVAKFKKLG